LNLNEFDKTTYSGLYVSKKSHPVFGKKYVARFQYEKKRYLKVLGYTKKDSLNKTNAIALLKEFKNNIILNKNSNINDKLEAKITIKSSKVENKQDKNINRDTLNVLKDHIKYLENLLGNYKNIDNEILKNGINKIYDLEELKYYQIDLIKMQKYLENTNKKIIIIFEGRDASGKGGAIRRITRYMNNKHYRIVALGKPNDTQRNQWFFQRYTQHFPTGGEIVLFDRSWYNRAMVEPIFGFCTQEEYEIFMEDVVSFENNLVRQDIILIKLYFSVSKAEQKKRFDNRSNNPLKQWKFSEVDMQAQDLWDDFSKKKYEMLRRTSSKTAPWYVVRSDNKHKARLEAIKIILNCVDYDNKNYALNFEPDEKINISVQKELSNMRKNIDY
jgi:polyphosphate kinase